MVKTKKEAVTVDTLASMIEKGFNESRNDTHVIFGRLNDLSTGQGVLSNDIAEISSSVSSAVKVLATTFKQEISDLAVMINKGFREAHKDLLDAKSELRAEFKTDLTGLRQDMNTGFQTIHRQIDDIHRDFTPRKEHELLKTRVTKIEAKV